MRMGKMLFSIPAAAAALAVAFAPLAIAQSTSFPIVDLGYELHQATLYNSTGNFYNFSNIRYAAPPTGENRWRPPQPPAVNRKVVQQGLPDRICPQAAPTWTAITNEYIPLYLAGQTVFNASSFNTSGVPAIPPQDPRTTEDCLFLDVVVPKSIFDNAGKGNGAPVLVWIYGGGYTTGSKSGSGNPAGLIARSESNGTDGVIYVSLNYRLGVFGWLSGPTLQANGVANVGFLDQRLALEWVQANIAKFGGDRNRVTVFGESAGGGSIMYQLTAYGGLKGPAPFQQAILQSPGLQSILSNQQQERIFDGFLAQLNVSTIKEARQLPFPDLLRANILQINPSPYGSYTYGPVVDGDFVPAMPGELLLHGQYDKNGLLFASPFIQNDTAFADALREALPTIRAWPSVLKYITDVLYPPIFDGSQAMGYRNQIARAAALISEVMFTCNTFYLDKAYGNNTYSYYFSIPPALHGEDVPYTYYNGPSPSVISTPIAIALQEYITHFAVTGSPNGPGVPYFTMYGDNATVLNLNTSCITEIMDPAATYRCNWWQKSLYL